MKIGKHKMTQWEKNKIEIFFKKYLSDYLINMVVFDLKIYFSEHGYEPDWVKDLNGSF